MIQITDDGAVRVLALNRPEVLNAFNGGLFDALVETCSTPTPMRACPSWSSRAQAEPSPRARIFRKWVSVRRSRSTASLACAKR